MDTEDRKGRVTVNAYQRKSNTVAAVMLCAMLAAAPACAQAMETAPLVPGRQAQQQTQERLHSFGRERSFRGVSASDKWLRQARIGGVMLNLRTFTAMGEEVTFQEELDLAPDGGICLFMQASSRADSLMLQLDQPAIDVLKRVDITQIVLADFDGNVRMRYQVDELEAVRKALALTDAEQLCVSGEDDPITVVSEDGVRRQVTN